MNSIEWFIELQKEQTEESYEKAKQACTDLKGRFEDYLTCDVSSPCERLPDDYQRAIDTHVSDTNEDWVKDLDEWWKEVDKDIFFQRKMGEK